jgi:hypothetical protein
LHVETTFENTVTNIFIFQPQHLKHKMMKKLLLFICVLAMIGSAVAQKRTFPKNLQAVPIGKTAHPEMTVRADDGLPTTTLASPVVKNRPKSTSATIDTMWIGSSVNAYTLLIAQQRCLWYDKATDAIMGTFRGNNSTTYPNLTYLTGNDLVNYYTLDRGLTWSKRQGVADGTRHRYPSGVISNPDLSTDINSTYSVMAGPETDGSNWTYQYKVSKLYDGTNLDIQRTPTSADGELLRQGLTATEDGMVHYCGDKYAGDYTSSTLMTLNGTFNAGNTIDWTDTDISLDNLITRKSDNSLVTFFGDAHMAWNNDGSVGYVFVRGSDIRPVDKPSWVPILFKTTDGGSTWNQLDYFDFSTLTEITDWILPVSGGENIYKPMFTDFGLTVDYKNNPHIFALIRGAASKNTDSLTYIWTYKIGGVDHDADNNYVEVWIDSTGNWQAHHIDTVWADEVTDAESNYTSSTGPVGWDHRLQASRSYDGKKVFGVWADSYYKFWGTDKFLFNPDIFIFGHGVKTGEMIYDTTQTVYSDVWGISFFHFVSPIAPQVTNDFASKYMLPVTVEDITSTGNSADNPVYHIWVNGLGMEFMQPDTSTGIDQKTNGKVSSLFPNPSSGNVSFSVSLDVTSNVSVEVTDLTGQVVGTRQYGMLPTGTHKLNLNNSNLSSGVYFCNFILGDQKVTKKMIVR